MAVMEGYDYDEYQVYVSLPHEALEENACLLDDIIKAGAKALGIESDLGLEVNWVDSLYI